MVYYPAMDTVLFFQTSAKSSSREKIVGALRYLEASRWAIQLIEQNLRPRDVRKALAKWQPLGCIVERGLAIGRNPTRLLDGIPTVYIDQNQQTATDGKWYISNDSASAVRLALRELAYASPRHYAFVRYSRKAFWSDERERAFVQALGGPGAACTILDDGLELPERLAALPKPCGLLAANDQIAQKAINAANKAGIDMPTDLRVVGINNDEFICTHTSPTLTSVHLDFEGCGYLAMATLHQIAQNPKLRPKTALLGPRGIVKRASTRAYLRKDARVTRAVDYMIAHYADPNLSTATVATVMGCSRSLADLRFRESTGATIRGEIRRVRIEAAQRLLANPSVQLSAIPSLCGYASVPTFANTFRAETGLTMSAWRARALARASSPAGPRVASGS